MLPLLAISKTGEPSLSEVRYAVWSFALAAVAVLVPATVLNSQRTPPGP
jgi:hypothetical protein